MPFESSTRGFLHCQNFLWNRKIVLMLPNKQKILQVESTKQQKGNKLKGLISVNGLWAEVIVCIFQSLSESTGSSLCYP